MAAAVQTPPGWRVGFSEAIKIVFAGQPFDSLAAFLQIARDFGGITYNEFGPVKFYLISDPELMREVLVEKAEHFHKADLTKQAFGAFLGNGLLNSEDDFWKRQRKLAQPAFHTRRIEGYGDTMVAYTQEMIDGWHEGETRRFDTDMMKLTMRIVAKTLFDADVQGDAERVGATLAVILENTNERINAVMNLPEWMPTPRRLATRSAVSELDSIINRIIAERRANKADRGDLLSMLLLAQDDDGSDMSDRQLRDEMMTIFLAGHETTAMALTWTWYLLAQHPDVLAKLQAEADAVLGKRAATVADLAALPYNEQVVKEAMRLYPPAPGAARQPVEDVRVGNYTLPQGALINVSIYAAHHDPALYPDPERFDPERFTPEAEKARHRYAYLPFGGGPRICIGNSFAMMEARLILATMVQHTAPELVAGQTITPVQMVTVRPKDGMRMVVRCR
jgi:cytochrome P450